MHKKINRILIDIGHPAHVHLFKNFVQQLIKDGYEILFTCRDKEFVIDLLKHYKFNYIILGKNYKSIAGKSLGLIKFDIKQLLTSLKFKPDIFLSHSSMYAAHASFVLRKPHISVEDTFNFEQIKLYEPFTEVILTSDYEHPLKSKKIIKYAGYHELAYLHPKYFIPNKNIFSELGLSENEKYVILRFISWNASHDIGHKGMSLENKLNAVREFEKYAKVYISSESELPSELKKYKIKLSPHKIHDALAFSQLLFGESTTMAEECAMLGVPSCIVYKHKTVYTQHLETKYNLLYNFSLSPADQINAIAKALELLTTPNIKEEWKKRTQQMLSEKIDVTAFMVWFIENYPESVHVMKQNPEYQYHFK